MADEQELAKDLGLASGLTIGIGTMIGAGIFVLPGVAAQRAGPLVVLSFILGGMIAVLNALSVSELGTAMPKAGGAYYFVNRALGPVFGSISGLGDWLGLSFASAFYTIGFGQYLAELIVVPSVLFLNEIQVGAVLAGVLFVGVNYIGAKETGGVQTAIVTVLLLILGVFALVGWLSFDYGTLVGSGGLVPLGVDQLVPTTGLVFVSFLGYAKIATVAEEMKNPGRNLPIAIVGSVVIVTILYAILVLAMLGVVPWPDLDLQAPVSQVTSEAFPAAIVAVSVTAVTLAALLATASSANASILASARINFAMGRDKIVTDWLNEIHPRFATPYRSILVTGVLIIGFAAVLGRDIALLAEAASVLHLIVFALLNAALIVFRETDVPDYDPEFRVPLYPVVPILGMVLSLGLIAFMTVEAQLVALLFIVGAVGWYVVYARRKTPIEGALGVYIRERPEEMPDLAVSAAEVAAPESSGPYTVVVPISNPRTEEALVEIASAIARHRDGVVHAVHIIQVPDQTALEQIPGQLDRIDSESDRLLERAREIATAREVDIETHTIVSHRSLDEIFDAAERLGADTVVMGWTPKRPWATGRTGTALEELTLDLPCDFLVVKDRGFDPARILLPTAGGPDSDIGAEAALAFREIYGSEVTVLHVVEDPDDRARAMSFIADWADRHGLGDANFVVDVDPEIEASIGAHVREHTLLLLGATHRGLLTRLIRGSLVYDLAGKVDSTIILTERPSKRGLRERLFGRS